MSDFKGTPGPWFWENGVLCNKDFIIGGGGHAFQNQANANLIAAAPEILGALELILSYHDDGNCVLHQDDVSMAKAAIKKALGR